MLALIASALVLALVGFDPAGGVLAAAALALGAKSRDVAIFGAAVIGLSAAYGAILSLTIGTRLAHFDWAILLTQNWRRAGIESALALLILGWMLWRVRRGDQIERAPKSRKVGLFALTVAGILYSTLSLLDPSLAALVVVAGRGHSVPAVILVMVVWSVVSQLPLALLLGAMVFGAHHRGVDWFQRYWASAQPKLRTALTAVLGIAGLFLAYDSLFWVVGRTFVIHGPVG